MSSDPPGRPLFLDADEAHPTLHKQNPGLSPDPPRVYAAKARIASGIVSLNRGRSSMVEP